MVLLIHVEKNDWRILPRCSRGTDNAMLRLRKAETIIEMLCPCSIIIIQAIISFFIRNLLVLQSPSEIFQRILYSAEMLSCKMCKWGWNKAQECGQGDWDGISRPRNIEPECNAWTEVHLVGVHAIALC